MGSGSDRPGKRFNVVHSRTQGAALPGHAASLSVLRVEARSGGSHIAVPSDLYTLTVYCDDSLACQTSGDGSALRAVVSTLRTRAGMFNTHGAGQLAIAQLTPLGLLQAFGFPLDSLTDRRLAVRDMDCVQAEVALQDLMLDAHTGAERSAALGRWLEARAAQRRLEPAARRVAAVAMEMLEGGDEPVDEQARRHGVSRRQLERDFRRWLGVAPTAYARLARFQRAATAVAEGSSLAHAAADHGYADQAHMTRAFRDIAGLTPGHIRQSMRASDAGRDKALRSATGGRLVMLPLPARSDQAGMPTPRAAHAGDAHGAQLLAA